MRNGSRKNTSRERQKEYILHHISYSYAHIIVKVEVGSESAYVCPGLEHEASCSNHGRSFGERIIIITS